MIKAVLSYYFSYSELHVNILFTLNQLTFNIDKNTLVIYIITLQILTAQKLNLEDFKLNFDFVRGKLHLIGKLLHNLHLNILANFSEIIHKDDEEKKEDNIITILNYISADFRSFFKNTTGYKKIYEDFKERKFGELDIQDTITRIGLNLSKDPQFMYNIVDDQSLFIPDLVDFLTKIVNSKASNNRETFIDNLTNGRYKGKNQTIALKTVLRIVENSYCILYNAICSPDKLYEKLIKKLESKNFSKSDKLIQFLREIREILVKVGCNVEKVDTYIGLIDYKFDYS